MKEKLLEAPSLEVDVAYYDELEKQKFSKYPPVALPGLAAIAGQRIKIPTATFLYFYLFHKLGRNIPGYESTSSLRARTSRAVAAIDSALVFNGHSIALPSPQTEPPNEVLEHMGEAIGLAVASRLHDLTEADWQRLKVEVAAGNKKLVPSFDFQLAAAASTFVQLETKGSAAEDNALKKPNISQHKANIATKKGKLANLAAGVMDPYPAAVRYGTISVVDGLPDSRVRCWLVDPPADRLPMEPRDYRLLARMTFYMRWLSLILPRSQLTSALASRLNALRALANPFDLADVPLLRGSGEPFKFEPTSARSGIFGVFNTKSKAPGDLIGGVAFSLSSRRIAFVGIDQDVLPILAEQRFEQIGGYRRGAASRDAELELILSRDEVRRTGSSLEEWDQLDANHRRLKTKAKLHVTASGLSFAIVKV